MYSFLETFRAYLRERGMPYTDAIADEYDVLFVNAWVVPYEEVRRVKRARPAVRVVHRVDGAARDYGREDDADAGQARVNLAADVTIFQSRYSKFSATEKYRVIHQDGPVIYNPVDVHRFTPEGAARPLPPRRRARVASAAWSMNRRKGMWQIGDLAAAYPDVDFVLCGRFDAVADQLNVHRLGPLSRDEMAAALRACDVFLNLSENDPCPNVVLEALATGLPVMYRDSGGVRELVGECGVAIELPRFGEALERVIADRDTLSRAARQRAVGCFAPGVIFPQYLEAIDRASPRPLPGRRAIVALARQGYPVLRRPRTVARAVARAVYRRVSAPAVAVRARSADRRASMSRVGWITYDSFAPPKRRLRDLESFTRMRVGNIAEWINANSDTIHNELYRPGRRYDVVVFQKMMDARCQAEARALRASGTKIVFDANVNYYESWGDYFVPGTHPTDAQQRDAIAMTRLADQVVADSSYLAEVIHKITPRVVWIPDNVDIEVYRGIRAHGPSRPVRLVWSGVGKKAAHLLLIRDALAAQDGIELLVVAERPPEVLGALDGVVPWRFIRFSDAAYARTLLAADIIVSPKRLVNAYEMGHTEYKITLGMAVGLPAIASPQPSYVEALAAGGGIIADTAGEWRAALDRLVGDHALRASMGAVAHRTVRERYSTPVVAAKYLALLEMLVGAPAVVVGESA